MDDFVSDREQRLSLPALYALNALDPVDHVRAGVILAEDADLGREAGAFHEVVTVLAMAVRPVVPSDALKAWLLSAIHTMVEEASPAHHHGTKRSLG